MGHAACSIHLLRATVNSSAPVVIAVCLPAASYPAMCTQAGGSILSGRHMGMQPDEWLGRLRSIQTSKEADHDSEHCRGAQQAAAAVEAAAAAAAAAALSSSGLRIKAGY